MREEATRVDRPLRGLAAALVALVLAALVLGACGGDEEDVDERAGTYTVEIEELEFPTTQRLAEEQSFAIAVRNAGTEAIPNLAITVDGFSTHSDQPGMADPQIPVWVVQAQPRAGAGAFANTWSFGRLEPGETLRESWNVAPVMAGEHELNVSVAAGLQSDTRAELGDGAPARRSLTVDVQDEVPRARVTADGEVVREPVDE